MSADVAPEAGRAAPPFDESHFTPEHIADFAYRKARGRTWEMIAHEFNHPNPDRLRRTLEKDPAFKAALAEAKRDARDEADCDGLQLLRIHLRDKDAKVARAAAKIIFEHTAKHAERENKLLIEQTRAQARMAVEEKRAEAKAAKVEKKVKPEPVPLAVRTALLAPAGRVFLASNQHPADLCPPNEHDTPVRIECAMVNGVDFYYVRNHPPAVVDEWRRATSIGGMLRGDGAVAL